MSGSLDLTDSLSLSCLILLTDQHTGEPVTTNPGVPVHACRFPPIVFLECRDENSAFYLLVNTLAEVWRELIEWLLQHVPCPDDETGGLCIEEIHFLISRQRDAFVVVGRYAPPSLFAETAHSIDNIVYEASFPLHDFCHDYSRQLSALLKTGSFVVYAVAIDLVLCEDRPWQRCPRLP